MSKSLPPCSWTTVGSRDGTVCSSLSTTRDGYRGTGGAGRRGGRPAHWSAAGTEWEGGVDKTTAGEQDLGMTENLATPHMGWSVRTIDDFLYKTALISSIKASCTTVKCDRPRIDHTEMRTKHVTRVTRQSHCVSSSPRFIGRHFTRDKPPRFCCTEMY